MKKILLSAAALMAAMTMNAQEVVAFNVDNALGLDADNGTSLTAGTVVGESASIVATIGADDTYKPQNVSANINGTDYAGGLQGNTNPKDEDGGSASSTLKQPVSGAFLKFSVKADGYLYVIHKASSNKAYTVFESGTAIGYTFAAIGGKDPLPAVYQFTLKGEGEFNEVKNPVEFAEQEYLKATNPAAYEAQFTVQDDGTSKWTNISAGGVGVIVIPVYAEAEEYVVNANGSKLTALGYAFSTEDNLVIKSGDVTIYSPDGAPAAGGDGVLAEVNLAGLDAFGGWVQFDASQEEAGSNVVPGADGIEITVKSQTGQLWQPQIMVIPDGSIDLELDGNYKVVVVAKFPTDGELQINMGTWGVNDQHTTQVTSTGDFQEVEVEFLEYPDNAEGAHVLFQCGDFLGTTILKSVKVINLDGASGITNVNAVKPLNDARYNLAGQKVDASYKGVVIQNGKKYLQK